MIMMITMKNDNLYYHYDYHSYDSMSSLLSRSHDYDDQVMMIID